MSKDSIELPPLPPLHIVPSVEPVDYPEVAQVLMDYARAAVAADRKRRGEPEAFAKDGNLFWRGDPVAWRGFSGGLYLAPQPAEPVKVNAVFETEIGEIVGTTNAKVKRVEWQDDGSFTVVIDYWPQPAEMEDPNASPLSGKGPFKTASELIDSINEPVNASPTIAYCQHPHCQTTGGCQGPCSKKQSEPVKVPGNDERAAIKADRQRRGEQVQAWKRDAERYRWLRRADIEDMAVVLGLGAMDYGSSVVVYTYSEELVEEDLDEVIDAAMEKKS